jgi:hypothetical protein
MNRGEFLHELKQIAQIQQMLRYNRIRYDELEEKLMNRINSLLDETNRFLNEQEKEMK